MKQYLLKNNFSAGELNPILSTRTDIQQYANGAKTILNAIPLVEGGVKKRPGTFIRGAYDVAYRLIPFVTRTDSAFLLVLGLGWLVVYNPRTRSNIVSLNTPYDTAKKVQELQFIQTRHRMYLAQGDTPLHRLITSEDFANWELAPFVFITPPLDEIQETPSAALKPSGTEVGANILLEAQPYPTWSASKQYYVGDRVAYNMDVYECLTSNVNKQPDINTSDWSELTGTALDIFSAENVGDYIKINSGIVKITEFIDARQVRGDVITKLVSDVEAIARSWTLETRVFSDNRGYPRVVSYFKQRLVLANITAYPNKIWFSRIGDDGDFLETTEDADAFNVASSAAQADNILHLAQRGGMVALTGGAEFLISNAGAFSPSTVQIDEHTSYGAFANVRPCRVGNELLFVQRGGERLRAMSFKFEADGLVSPELSVLSAHIPKGIGIKEITYQQAPDSLVWLVLGNGSVATITLNREQEVSAWAKHDFSGKVISMCALPTELGSDYCFALIERKGDVYLEELSINALADASIEVNAANRIIEDARANLYSSACAYYKTLDGQFYDDAKIVTPQTIELNSYSGPCFVGEPIQTKIQLYPPELTQAPSTTLSYKMTIHKITLTLFESLNVLVNGKPVQTKDNKQNAFANHPFTGRTEIDQNGWGDLYNFDMTIMHNKPLPFHLQAISMQISINER